MIRKIFHILLIVLFSSCKQGARSSSVESVTPAAAVPAFSADSAFDFVRRQVDFGPRVPNTSAHQACAAYLSASLKRYGAEVTEQRMELTAFDGTKLDAVNIIGVFKPEQKNRILLFAHWDSRPWSDHDPDPANRNKPVAGANDGASGVGVLLEIARQIGMEAPETGVDIIFFDAEDYGAPADFRGNAENSWCLGSQYWAKNPHTNPYRAKFGILLDMVGAGSATFMREQISDHFAKDIVDKVWHMADHLGFNKYFVDRQGGMVTDDHYYINIITGIPCVDIIDYSPENEKGFGDYWHTVNDDMSNIDKNTLFAVGTTVMGVVYNEK